MGLVEIGTLTALASSAQGPSDSSTLRCAWTSSTTLRISNFSTAPLWGVPSTLSISISGGKLRAAPQPTVNNTATTPSASVPLASPTNPIVAVAKIAAPSTAGNQSITVDGSASTGGAARALTYRWTISVPATTSIPAQLFSSSSATFLPPCVACTVAVNLEVRNWLDRVASTTVNIVILPLSGIPAVAIVNGTTLSVSTANSSLAGAVDLPTGLTLASLTWTARQLRNADVQTAPVTLPPLVNSGSAGAPALVLPAILAQLPGSEFSFTLTACSAARGIAPGYCSNATVLVQVPSVSPPVLLGARMFNSGIGFSVNFSIPTNMGGARRGVGVPCSSLLAASTLSVIGVGTFSSGYQCAWFTESRFAVALGASFFRNPSTIQVALNTSAIIRSANNYSVPATLTTISLDPAPARVLPTAVISGLPATVSFCQDFTASASQSKGSAGHFTYAWSLFDAGSGDPVAFLPRLTQRIAASPTASSVTLLVPWRIQGTNQSTFQDDFRMLGADFTFGVRLSVTNWLGDSSTASVIVTASALPRPQLVLDGPVLQTIVTRQSLQITAAASMPGVYTAADIFGDSTSCPEGAAVGSTFAYTWRATNGPAGYQSVLPNNALSGVKLAIAPMTLLVGETYVFRCTATLISSSTNHATLESSVNVSVTVAVSTPVAVITGASLRTVTESEVAVYLDASRSYHYDYLTAVAYDASAPATSVPLQTAVLQYDWSCALLLPNEFQRSYLSDEDIAAGNFEAPPCFEGYAQEQFEALNAVNDGDISVSGVILPALADTADGYNFTVTVRRADDLAGTESYASVVVRVMALPMPVVNLEWQRETTSSVSLNVPLQLVSRRMLILSSVSSRFGFGLSNLAYLWQVYVGSSLVFEDTSVNLAVPADTLPYDSDITVNLQVWSVSTESPNTIPTIAPSYGVGMASLNLRTSGQPPAGGSCTLSPTVGNVTTLFTISCFDWADAEWYQFDCDTAVPNVPLSSTLSRQPSWASYLPLGGGALSSGTLRTLHAYIQDEYGQITTVALYATVLPSTVYYNNSGAISIFNAAAAAIQDSASQLDYTTFNQLTVAVVLQAGLLMQQDPSAYNTSTAASPSELQTQNALVRSNIVSQLTSMITNSSGSSDGVTTVSQMQLLSLVTLVDSAPLDASTKKQAALLAVAAAASLIGSSSDVVTASALASLSVFSNLLAAASLGEQKVQATAAPTSIPPPVPTGDGFRRLLSVTDTAPSVRKASVSLPEAVRARLSPLHVQRAQHRKLLETNSSDFSLADELHEALADFSFAMAANMVAGEAAQVANASSLVLSTSVLTAQQLASAQLTTPGLDNTTGAAFALPSDFAVEGVQQSVVASMSSSTLNFHQPSLENAVGGVCLTGQVCSPVVSLTLFDSISGDELSVQNLSQPIIAHLPVSGSPPPLTAEEIHDGYTMEPVCRYWDTSSGSWSSDGCVAIGYSATLRQVQCNCTHLTDFSAQFALKFPDVNVLSASDFSISWRNLIADPVPIGLVVGLGGLFILLLILTPAWEKRRTEMEAILLLNNLSVRSAQTQAEKQQLVLLKRDPTVADLNTTDAEDRRLNPLDLAHSVSLRPIRTLSDKPVRTLSQPVLERNATGFNPKYFAPRCPLQHKMVLQTSPPTDNYSGGGICDSCSDAFVYEGKPDEIKKTGGSFHCAQCTFDICVPCVARSAKSGSLAKLFTVERSFANAIYWETWFHPDPSAPVEDALVDNRRDDGLEKKEEEASVPIATDWTELSAEMLDLRVHHAGRTQLSVSVSESVRAKRGYLVKMVSKHQIKRVFSVWRAVFWRFVWLDHPILAIFNRSEDDDFTMCARGVVTFVIFATGLSLNAVFFGVKSYTQTGIVSVAVGVATVLTTAILGLLLSGRHKRASMSNLLAIYKREALRARSDYIAASKNPDTAALIQPPAHWFPQSGSQADLTSFTASGHGYNFGLGSPSVNGSPAASPAGSPMSPSPRSAILFSAWPRPCQPAIEAYLRARGNQSAPLTREEESDSDSDSLSSAKFLAASTAPSAESSALALEWLEGSHRGQIFFYNPNTGETRWTRPSPQEAIRLVPSPAPSVSPMSSAEGEMVPIHIRQNSDALEAFSPSASPLAPRDPPAAPPVLPGSPAPEDSRALRRTKYEPKVIGPVVKRGVRGYMMYRRLHRAEIMRAMRTRNVCQLPHMDCQLLLGYIAATLWFAGALMLIVVYSVSFNINGVARLKNPAFDFMLDWPVSRQWLFSCLITFVADFAGIRPLKFAFRVLFQALGVWGTLLFIRSFTTCFGRCCKTCSKNICTDNGCCHSCLKNNPCVACKRSWQKRQSCRCTCCCGSSDDQADENRPVEYIKGYYDADSTSLYRDPFQFEQQRRRYPELVDKLAVAADIAEQRDQALADIDSDEEVEGGLTRFDSIGKAKVIDEDFEEVSTDEPFKNDAPAQQRQQIAIEMSSSSPTASSGEDGIRLAV